VKPRPIVQRALRSPFTLPAIGPLCLLPLVTISYASADTGFPDKGKEDDRSPN